MGSPIETMLLNSLLSSNDDRFCFRHAGESYGGSSASTDVLVSTQVQLGSYRVDIWLDPFPKDDHFKLAVECDGHDFHDRTKQQAAYDRSRDREMLVCGIFTVRFTGSEIVHSEDRCVADILRCLTSVTKIGRAYRRVLAVEQTLIWEP